MEDEMTLTERVTRLSEAVAFLSMAELSIVTALGNADGIYMAFRAYIKAVAAAKGDAVAEETRATFARKVLGVELDELNDLVQSGVDPHKAVEMLSTEGADDGN